MSIRYFIGIDPGRKNLGLAIVKHDTATGSRILVHSCVMNPSASENLAEFIKSLDDTIVEYMGHDTELQTVVIERFVSYQGVSTAETEYICMLIGAITLYFQCDAWWVENDTSLPKMELIPVRAIEWKTELVKALYKKVGFDNPSDKLDKEFSIAAAHACLTELAIFKTDHEADAVCLASYGILC